MEKTAQVVLINKEGMILGVSRKNDHNDMGLIGGKMDPEDNDDPIQTAIRECREETGLSITNLRLIFAIHKGGNMGYTYLADYSGEINHNEPHIVSWLPMEVLVRGSFGRYNQLVAESLDDLGINYNYTNYVDKMVIELKSFIASKIRNGYSIPFDFKRVTCNSRGIYNILLKGDFDSLFDEDLDYDEKIRQIGLNHHFNIRFPSNYYKTI